MTTETSSSITLPVMTQNIISIIIIIIIIIIIDNNES